MRLHGAGAAHVVATQEQDLVAEVMRTTNGNGARIAYHPIGGHGFPKLARHFRAGWFIPRMYVLRCIGPAR